MKPRNIKPRTYSGFVPKRITLSKEALEMAQGFQKKGCFRSLSETIEELIRRLHYIKEEGTLNAANIQLDRIGICLREA